MSARTVVIIIVAVIVVAAILIGLFLLRGRQAVISRQPTPTPTIEETSLVVEESTPIPTVEESPQVVDEPPPSPSVEETTVEETPVVAEEDSPVPLREREVEHRVIEGESLWRIAGYERYYNNPLQWLRIYAANSDRIFDPDLIFPHQLLLVPLESIPQLESNPYKRVAERWAALEEEPQRHFVLWGESLESIAGQEKYYGDSARWPEILQANPLSIVDPTRIFPKQILLIPTDIK